MIVSYHRPKTLSEALALLGQTDPPSLPLAGGTAIKQNRMCSSALNEPVAVVDLQDLGLDQVTLRGSTLQIGAMVRLQALLDAPLPQDLKRIIKLEATYNLRQMASLGGTLVAADGRSPLATAMLALDAHLNLAPGDEQVALGDLLPLRHERLPGRLITHISLPGKVKLAYEYVARSPADLPIVCAAAAAWPGGRIRLALGGYGNAPSLAFDGNEALGIESASRSAYEHAADDWASAEYRAEIAAVLAKRCVQSLNVDQ